MKGVGYENKRIYEKYQMISEARKGMRRKAQLIEDKIDDFMDEIEKKIDKIEDNPTFQRKMLQMLANTTKEYNEFLAILKQICQTLDSGAKVIPTEKPQKKNAPADNSQEEEPEAEETEEEGLDEQKRWRKLEMRLMTSSNVKESMLLEKPIPNIPQEWKSDPYIMAIFTAKSDKEFRKAFADLEQHHGAKMIKILIKFAQRTLKMYG